MSNAELSSIAAHVVGQYHVAGKALVNAYRSSAHRALGGAAARFSRVQPVTGFLATRLDADTAQLVSMLDRLASASTNGIEALASRAAQDATPGAATVRAVLTALHLPGAQLSAHIADQLAEGAQALETRASQDADAAVATQDDAPAKPARAAARPARRAVRQAA